MFTEWRIVAFHASLRSPLDALPYMIDDCAFATVGSRALEPDRGVSISRLYPSSNPPQRYCQSSILPHSKISNLFKWEVFYFVADPDASLLLLRYLIAEERLPEMAVNKSRIIRCVKVVQVQT